MLLVVVGVAGVVSLAVAFWLGRRLARRRHVGGRGPDAGAADGGQPPRARRLGVARPAHPAGRPAGDGRGARGRRRRRPADGGRVPPADPDRDRPDGRPGRRPVRAVPDQRRRAAAEPGVGVAGRPRVRRGRLGRAGRRPPAACSWSAAERGWPTVQGSEPELARVLGQPAAQRDPAHAVGRHRHDHRRPRRRAAGGSRSPTRAAASRRRTCPGSSTSRSGRRPHGRRSTAPGAVARDGGAAAGSGWRSCAGWSRPTTARSGWPTPARVAAFWSACRSRTAPTRRLWTARVRPTRSRWRRAA